MKPLTYSLIAAALACGLASATTTAYTTPVGYVSLGDTTVGQPAIKAFTDVSISIPLDRSPQVGSTQYVGQIASIAGDVITLSGTPALGDLTTIPHTVKIGSGANSGLIALITANTATTVTVSVQPGDSLTGIVSPDQIIINNAWTVLGLMGATVPAGTQVQGYSGLSTVENLAPDLIYEFDGTNWIDLSSFNVADNTVLYPTETILIRNNSASPIASLVISGQVPTTASRAIVVSAGTGTDNMLSFFGAVGQPIGTSGLSAIAHVGDQVQAYTNGDAGENKAPSVIIEFDGASWIDLSSFDDVTSTYLLQGGQGYLFRRTAGDPVGDAVWTALPSYVPTL